MKMSEARLESEWDRTALIAATIHNVNCAKRSSLIHDPSVLNPMRNKARGQQQTISLKELRKTTER